MLLFPCHVPEQCAQAQDVNTSHLFLFIFSPTKEKEKQFRPCSRHLLPFTNHWIHWGFSADRGKYRCMEGNFFRQIGGVTCQGLSMLWMQVYCDSVVVLRRYKAMRWPKLLRCLCGTEKMLDMCPFLLLPNAQGGSEHFCLLERCRAICLLVTAFTLRKSFAQYGRGYKHQ